MFTRIDHVMICVPDLARATEQYRKLGFNMHPGGVHTGKGTHNAIAFNREDYVELLAIRDRAEYEAAASTGRGWGPSLPEFIEAGGGIRYIIVQSDDLESDVAAMRGRPSEDLPETLGTRLARLGKPPDALLETAREQVAARDVVGEDDGHRSG